ncbi:MAG: hypothetical protein NWE87_04910 [Candidatus Bathyarchaeota archaeon]|nr:hypothetical protein [Candidatus Bathyarchaeota archaeon]
MSGFSWRMMPMVLRASQISAILPSSIRYIDTPVYSTVLPVGGSIRNVPCDVPRAVQCTTTMSPWATEKEFVMVRSGKACHCSFSQLPVPLMP